MREPSGIFISKEDEDIRVTIQYDDDTENTTHGTVYETDFSLLPCELLPDALVGAVGTMPCVMKYGDMQYSIVCRDPSHGIIYVTDFFTNGDDAVLEWNDLMEGLHQGKKVRVYDLRSAREDVPPPGRKPPETCGCVRCSDPVQDAFVSRTFAGIESFSGDHLEKMMEEEYKNLPGAPVWQEATQLANITTTLGNARMLVCGCVATWKSCPIFQTPEGKFLIASLMQAAEHILQTEEFIVQKRDPRWRQINQVWQDANREPEKTE